MGLIARGLERLGLPTVFVGHMLDIMRLNRPPRAAFLDMPLGHACGRPGDRAQQRAILRDVLSLLATATGPGTLVILPHAWGEPFTFTPGQSQRAAQQQTTE